MTVNIRCFFFDAIIFDDTGTLVINNSHNTDIL